MEETQEATTITKPKTADELFAILKEFFDHSDDSKIAPNEQTRAWDVLTALRGPDSENFSLKTHTTGIIRRALLGRSVPIGYTANSDHSDHAEARRDFHQFYPDEIHFRTHAKLAFEALGLQWELVNEKV